MRPFLLLPLCAACSGSPDEGPRPLGEDDPLYSVGSVVQDTEGNRTMYLHTVSSLDQHLDNTDGIEIPGNVRHWAHDGAVFIGLDEEPTLTRYRPDVSGALVEEGRVSFLDYGLPGIPAGFAFLSDRKAYLMSEVGYEVIIWDPREMTITGTLDLSAYQVEGYSVELWSATVVGDLLYVPLRHADFVAGVFVEEVAVIVIDHTTDAVVGVARDERCVAASQPMLGDDGYVYVMGDGRSYLLQVYAMASGEEPPHNCILRMKAGEATFDPDFFVDIPALTGGPDAATPLWGAPGSVAWARLFHAEDVPPGTDASGFAFWSIPAFRLWRFELGDTVVAEPVEGVPPGFVDFGGSVVDGHLFAPVSAEPTSTTVYEISPEGALERFTMDGLLRDIHRLR
jgi:hypothetical protein